MLVGAFVRAAESTVGETVGTAVGIAVGAKLGATVGLVVGALGLVVGAPVAGQLFGPDQTPFTLTGVAAMAWIWQLPLFWNHEKKPQPCLLAQRAWHSGAVCVTVGACPAMLSGV